MNYAGAGYVYAIRNMENNHMYVGSTTNYKSRWHTHRSALRRGTHHSFILQRAWDKYGEAAFSFELLLVCARKDRIDYETRLMQLETYNVLRTPKESSVRGGWTHSDEFKAKMSALHKGKTLSEEHRKKLSAARIGAKYGEEFKEKARARQLGVSPSLITRQRLSQSVARANADKMAETEAKVLLMYDRAKSGEVIVNLCVEFGVSPTTFYAHCKRLALPTFKHKVDKG